MRIVLRAPRSFTPASRIEVVHHRSSQLIGRDRNAKLLRLRDAKAGIAAGIDGVEGGKVHVDVEREAMISPAAHYADTERGHLGAVDVDARRAGLALRAAADEVDHRLLEQPHEAFYL